MAHARGEMRFQEEAQSALAFLNDRGFNCVAASERRVRYESPKVYIEMLHGLRDCEVYIEFGRLDTEERFSFTLFLQLVSPSLEKRLGDRMADTPDTIAATANALAQALQSKGRGIIKGLSGVFERMKDVRWWDFDSEALGKDSTSQT